MLCAGTALALYLVSLAIVPDLASAEPSYAGEVFPWSELLSRGSLLEVRDALEPAQYVGLHTWAAAWFLLLLLGLFIVYGLALRVVAGQRSSALAAAAFGAGAICLASQTMGPAMLSGDLFSYIIYGRIFALYGGDPYATVPGQYPGDAYLPLVYWKYVPSFYGPLWTLISAPAVWLGGERVGLTVLLFRGIAIAATLAAAGLIWHSLARIAPHRAAQGLIFFLWNPLTVLEAGLSGHNDALMVALLLLAIWLHLGGRRALAAAALTLSALVKYVTGLLLPLYLLLVLRQLTSHRQRGRYLATGGLGVALAVAGVLGPARTGPAVLAVGALGSGLDRYHNSLHELVLAGLRVELGDDPEWARVPLQFKPWWVMTHVGTELRSTPDEPAEALGPVEQWTPCLVLAPQEGPWLRVYDTASRRTGYILAEASGPLAKPPERKDGLVTRLEAGPAWSPEALLANAWLRLATWAAFGALWVLAAWRARHLRAFLAWSTAVLLAFDWLVAAWIWPWYVTWALALAAFVLGSWPAGLAGVLSATILGLYAAFGYEGTSEDWIYTYRSLPALLLPLVLFLLSQAIRSLAARARAVKARIPDRPVPS